MSSNDHSAAAASAVATSVGSAATETVMTPNPDLGPPRLLRAASSIDRLRLKLDFSVEDLVLNANLESPTLDGLSDAVAKLRKTQSLRLRRSDPGRDEVEGAFVAKGNGRTLPLSGRSEKAIGRSLSSPRSSVYSRLLYSPGTKSSASSRLDSPLAVPLVVMEDPKEGMDEEGSVSTPEAAAKPDGGDSSSDYDDDDPLGLGRGTSSALGESISDAEVEEGHECSEAAAGRCGRGRPMAPACLNRSVGRSRLNRVTLMSALSKSYNSSIANAGAMQNDGGGGSVFETAAASAIAAMELEMTREKQVAEEGDGGYGSKDEEVLPERPGGHQLLAQRSLSKSDRASQLSSTPRCNPWAPLAGPGASMLACQELDGNHGTELRTMDSMRAARG